MNNRRHDYRHPFSHDAAISVDVRVPGENKPRSGRLRNLSVTGMSVTLEGGEAHLRQDALCEATFQIPHNTRRFAFESRVVHTAIPGTLGLEFVPLVSTEDHEERERQLWLYLMDEQRQALRASRASRSNH